MVCGAHTINWFASHLSTQLSCFCGQFFGVPRCEGVDAFSQCWTEEMGWFFHPPFLGSRVQFDQLLESSAQGTVVVPF